MLNLPNLLSTIRILLVPPLVVVLLTRFEGKEWWGLGLFLLAAVMDFFDGFVARRRKQITRLGTLLDPAADKILVSAAYISLVALDARAVTAGAQDRPVVQAWIVVVIIAREFAVTSLRSFAAAEGLVIPSGLSGKIKTIVQIVSIALLIIYNQLGQFRHLAPISLWVAMLVTVYSGIEYFVRFGRLILRGEVPSSLAPPSSSSSSSSSSRR